MKKIVALLLLTLALGSCGEYQKALKSEDVAVKYELAEKLYDAGKYNESKKRWTQILDLFPANKLANEYIFKCELQLNPSLGEAMAKKIVQEGEGFLKKRE